MKLSIVIPVYNEINTILEVIKRVKNEKHEKEIIIVDDGSTDGTTELLQNIQDKNIKVIFNKTNRGKGYALRTAFRHVSGDITIIQDADLEYYPDEYGVLIKRIVEGKADVVYGTRFLGAHRVFHFYHFLGNQILNLIANVILDTNLTDLMTGFKAFKTKVIKQLVLKANRFGIEAEITAEVFKRGFRVYEVPISYEGRGYEEGKKIKWTDFFSCLYWLLKSYLRGIKIDTETLMRLKGMRNYPGWIYNKMKPFLGTRILELGSGMGTISKYLVAKDRYVTLTDYNEDYISYLNYRFISNPLVKVIKTDICRIDETLRNEKFDTVVCINVLEHIENDLELLKKIKLMLNEKGRFLLLVPACKILLGTLDKELGYLRRYTRAELTEKLRNAGFSIEKIEYMNLLSAIGWFINYKILKRRHLPKLGIKVIDKLIPFISVLEKNIKLPSGLSLFAIVES